MPKAIKGAHEAILAATGRLLASEGYANLNMRAIAAESGVATGTIYNYYRAKDELVFALMKDDWRETLDRMDAVVGESAEQGAQSPQGVASGEASKSARLRRLRVMFDILHGFTSKHAPVWRIMAVVPPEEKSPALKGYDTSIFVEEIIGRIRAVIGGGEAEYADNEENALLPALIARIFSVFSMDAQPDYAGLHLLLMKLLSP